MIVDTTQTKIERDIRATSEMTAPIWFSPAHPPHWVANRPRSLNIFIPFFQDEDE